MPSKTEICNFFRFSQLLIWRFISSFYLEPPPSPKIFFCCFPNKYYLTVLTIVQAFEKQWHVKCFVCVVKYSYLHKILVHIFFYFPYNFNVKHDNNVSIMYHGKTKVFLFSQGIMNFTINNKNWTSSMGLVKKNLTIGFHIKECKTTFEGAKNFYSVEGSPICAPCAGNLICMYYMTVAQRGLELQL